jgi:hypothetical protein
MLCFGSKFNTNAYDEMQNIQIGISLSELIEKFVM